MRRHQTVRRWLGMGLHIVIDALMGESLIHKDVAIAIDRQPDANLHHK